MELRPGVYSEEIDKSQVVSSGISNGVGSVVVSERGPINTLTLINSADQLLQRYGNPNLTSWGLSLYSAIMVSEATNVHYVNRVVEADAKYSNIQVEINASIEDPFVKVNPGFTLTEFDGYEYNSSDINKLFTISAANPGKWANNIGIKVSNVDSPESGWFTLEVYERINGAYVRVESYTDCSSNPEDLDGYGNSAYIEDKVNGVSEYIHVWYNTNYDVPFNTLTPQQMANLQTHLDTIIPLGGGENGAKVTVGTYALGYDLFKDTDKYSISFLGDGGQGQVAQVKSIAISKERDDTTAIHSTTVSPATTAALVSYRGSQNINDSYGLLFGGNIKVRSVFNNKVFNLPLGFFALREYVVNAGTNKPWNPVMWFNGGVITSQYFIPIESEINYLNGDQNVMEAIQLNYPITKTGRGIILSGENTEQSKKSALSEGHIRITLNIIKSNVKSALEYFIGRTNTKATRTDARTIVDQYLADIMSGGALTGRTTICDTSNNTPQVIDNNNLIVDILLQFPRVIKRVLLRATIVGSNVTLQEMEV